MHWKFVTAVNFVGLISDAVFVETLILLTFVVEKAGAVQTIVETIQTIQTTLAVCSRQGLSLLHMSSQPEPFLSLKLPNASREKCTR